MDLFFVLLIIMLCLGVGDLIVGVSNDAANFLNSAIGSKAAKMWVIFAVASVGILFGAIFSSGMMEVARKGIFNPQFYSLRELFMIFLAVMLTDIVLLDLYNTLGLPTSTTVSLVFELLGASLFVGFLKTHSSNEAFAMINSAGALKIISGIFLSVIVAFSSGAIIMYITRFIFTFNLKKTMKRYGGIFAGICLSMIVGFILLKGMKKTTLLPKETIDFLKSHLLQIILVNAAIFTVIFQIFILKKKNVFPVLILIGTGALAMAFAGNDLVNFIGVPIAALGSYRLIEANGGLADISAEQLAEKVASLTFCW